MKGSIKILAYSLLFTPVVVLSNPIPFNGYYGAIDLGVLASQETINHSFIASSGPFISGGQTTSVVHSFSNSDPNKDTDSNITGGIILGYAHSFNLLYLPCWLNIPCWIFGVEGRFNLDHVVIQDTISLTTGSNALYASETSVTQNLAFSILGKLGFTFCENTLFYGLIGPQWGKFQIQTNSVVNDAFDSQNLFNEILQLNQMHYDCGILLGLGMERLLTCDLSIGLEYLYVNYGKLDYSSEVVSDFILSGSVNPGGSFINSNHIKMESNYVLLKLAYYFC